MNNDNNSIDRFNFGRLAFLLKKELIIRRRSLLLQLLLVVGVMSILNIFIAFASPEHGEPGDYNEATNFCAAAAAVVFFLAISVCTTVGASLSFSDLGNKADRVLSLMEPAAQSERFLARVLPGLLIPPLFVCFGQFVAEGVRVVVSEALYSADYLYHPYLFMERIGHLLGSEAGYIMTLIFCSIGLSQCLYLLGSAVWPRLSFIKTFAALQALGSFLGILIMILVAAEYRGFGSLSYLTVLYMSNVFIILLSVATVGIAYLRYREIEVVQRW